jgi:protein TonB
MAFRALLFSKAPDTNAALTEACEAAGVQLEICDDIFSAIDKGTRQPFSCVLVNWSDQPEASFLLKRARESKPNLNTVAIAIVEREPTSAEMRDHRLSFLIYRPVAIQEAREVLIKAMDKMPDVSAAAMPKKPQPTAPLESLPSAPTPAPSEQTGHRNQPQEPAAYSTPSAPDHEPANETANDGANDIEPVEQQPRPASPLFSLRTAVAAVVVLGLAFALWNARDAIGYLAQTRENRANIFKQAVASVFGRTANSATAAAPADLPPDDPYFKRGGASDANPKLGVVAGEADVADSRVPLRKPPEVPLPAPVYEPPPPAKAPREVVPESLRGSAPIAPPVVVTVNPAQMMPVSSPATPAFSTQQFSEPVSVTEQAERALLVHIVDPAYPPEAAAQKLRGPVVLQATIGRDGNVEDLKIVRGSFVLSKAAIAAVKQWRFQPYTVGGRPVQTQTFLTVDFNPPTS